MAGGVLWGCGWGRETRGAFRRSLMGGVVDWARLGHHKTPEAMPLQVVRRYPEVLLISLLLLCALLLFAAPLHAQSGHHYSYLEGAAIGHDFGRNPWSANGTIGFTSRHGRANLRRALERAVQARETAMSFDFAFDLRSIVVVGGDGSIVLDRYALASVDAFLVQVEEAHQEARLQGRSFSADVVLFDFRLADGQRVDERVSGEYPRFFSSARERDKLFAALAPALQKLGRHPRITLNLMNEPELLAVPVAKAIARIESGEWAQVPFVGADPRAAGKIVVVQGTAAIALLQALGDDGHVRVNSRRGYGAEKIVATSMRLEQVDAFLLDLRAAVQRAAPAAKVTIGWANDRSALENTQRLEQRAGGVVTEVISFHVYQVPINPWHPLRLSRADFARVGWGGRSIRITEWGLGRLRGQEQIRLAMQEAFSQLEGAGLEGVLFWWDVDHAFDHAAYGVQLGAGGKGFFYALVRADFFGDLGILHAGVIAVAQQKALGARHAERFD